ncbi:MAG: FhaA domain-containing protein [Solirubrobacteraceae bacterium]
MLKNIENKIAGLVEGTFSRAFKSEVRPVEIARKLAREMEENKTFSVSRVYVPNEYAVYLSPQDRERFADYEGALASELSGYLLEHARREKLALLSRPAIEFRMDDRLRLGEFGIQARMVQPPEEERPSGSARGEMGHTMVYSAAGTAGAADGRLEQPLEARRGAAGTALVLVDGRRMVLEGSPAVVGRSRGCEIVVDDPNVSRKHAEIERTAEGWAVRDLDSTNGVIVNGRRIVAPHHLQPGDRMEIGTSEIVFALE